MAYTTIDNPQQHFNTKLYAGNGGTQSITGVGFKPDWVWIKNRSGTDQHSQYDIVRGVNKVIRSSGTGAEGSQSDGLTAFGSDGFSVGAAGSVNTNSNNFASWNWLAGGSQGSSNTDGTINSTYTSANTTAGFSIVKYTGTGSNATVGHGLGTAPRMIIFKNTNSTRDWAVYHADLVDPDNYLSFNRDYAKTSGYNFSNATAPTSSVFSVGTLNGNNGSSQEYIAYCFADKQGFSKFGAYRGNNSSAGPCIYTGFRPAFLIVKKHTDTNHWIIWDNKRSTKSGGNVIDKKLYANLSNAENGADDISFLSNGFKFHTNTGDWNEPQGYIYMAFADSPFVNSNGVPTNAQ